MMADEQRLDGNAAGGMLGQIFVAEMTIAQITCASCGQAGPIGATAVYTTAMETIIR